MTTQMSAPLWTSSRKAILAGLLGVQFIAAYVMGTGGWLVNDTGSLVPPVVVSAVVPVLLFLAAYALSPAFKRFILSQDIRTLTMLQLWRVVGFVFLPLYAFDILPGLFAWPAGLGDVAVGLTAAVVVARIDRNPDYVKSSGIVWFHLMGLFDFAVAIVTAALAAGALPQMISNGVTSAPLDVWPLNIFPNFLVPAFIIAQLTVLLNVYALRRRIARPAATSLRTA